MNCIFGGIRKGFTIVELLIVVVVIAILASITIIAYNGIQNRARTSAMVADVTQAVKSLEQSKLTNGSGVYPASLNVTASGTSMLTYYRSSESDSYCVESKGGTQVQSATNSDMTVKAVPCTANGLIGWWDLNDGTTDTLGNGRNGTISSPVPATGANNRANGAYSFTSSTPSSMVLPRPAPYTDTGATSFSVSVWMRTTSTEGQRTAFSTAASGNGIRVGHGAGRAYYLIGSDAGHREGYIGTSGTLNNNQWRNLVLSVERRSGDWLLTAYVDGVVMGTEAISTANVPVVGTGNVAYIGSMNSSAMFNGTIDDIRVFSRALTQAEAQALFERGAQ